MNITYDNILKTAIEMVECDGLINLSCKGLCDKVGIPEGSWLHITKIRFTDFIKVLKRLDIKSQGSNKVIKSRTDPQLRKEQILESALYVAQLKGINKMQRVDIANHAGVSENLVSKYFGTMVKLKRSVIRAALNREDVQVLRHCKDIKTVNLSMSLRTKLIELKNK